jgi:hypothetical protein
MIDEELNAERFENGKFFAEIPLNLPCLLSMTGRVKTLIKLLYTFLTASNSNSDDLMLASDLEKAVESIQYPFARRDVYAASTFHGVEVIT